MSNQGKEAKEMRNATNNFTPKSLLGKFYKRIGRNVDFDLLSRTTFFCIGIGAIGPAIEHWGRLGIKRFYLFDYKKVHQKNLVAQNFIHDDIGLSKTEALSRRLRQCEFEKGNPDISPLQIHTFGDFLAISDEELELMVQKEKAKGREIVFVMASDLHPAQARGNRIAQKYGVTVFWVGIYRMGMAGEIVFYTPGHDLPCYRCITESRFHFFDKNRLTDHLKGKNNGAARSSGLPMAASFIDAILSHLIIGHIHRNIAENQHGQLYRRILDEKRNLIQCQLDPNYRLNDAENIFSQIKGPDQIAFNTIFQSEPKNPECIDCYGAPGGHVWRQTDYTKESYRNVLEAFSEQEAAFRKGISKYKHPLLDAYADLFPVWEQAFCEA
jgi:hypothetical protein